MTTYFDETEGGARIEVRSNGWSGEVVHRRPYGAEIMYFQYDIEHHVHVNDKPYDGSLITASDNKGFAPAGNDAIIGLSLEHFGLYNDGSENIMQCCGFKTNSGHYGDWMPAFGGDDNSLNIYYDNVKISHYFVTNVIDGQEEEVIVPHDLMLQTSNNIGVTYIRYEYVPGIYHTIITTDLPIFETDADLLEYCQSGGTVTNKILNQPTTPEENYEKARNYRYIRNIYGHNANSVTGYTGYRNYRFYGGDGKICFYRETPTESAPFNLRLYHYNSYNIKEAPIFEYDDEDYEEIESAVATQYLDKSIQFNDSNWYKAFVFNTDILIFGSAAQAQQWVDDLIDARSAENFNDVSRAYDSILDPGYGNPDPGYDNGINGQSYVHGARMWVMSSSQLNNFFDDIFDPVHITDIINGTKLLGDGIQAIQGITYFPIDIDDVATVYSSAQAIKIGSYSCPTATGRYVQNNNKMIDCGSVFIAPVYNDFRDYKIKLFLSLPYVGLHEIEISKALNHNLQVKYAVDITTGACTAHVLFDGISYGDSYDGFMASQRPLTALDQTAYLNSVMGCVSSIVGREAGLISSAKSAIAGVATGGAKETSGGGVSGISGAPSGLATSYGAISDLYGLSQAVKSQPMVTRGGFAGCLGFFGNQQIHIITIQSKTVKPSLEQLLVGYPSHVSQTVGSFSGFLKCSYFKMAAGFNGTLQEWNEIQEIMQGGIYL